MHLKESIQMSHICSLRCEYKDYITHETEQKGKFDFVSIKMRAPPQPGLDNGINQSLLQDQSRL